MFYVSWIAADGTFWCVCFRRVGTSGTIVGGCSFVLVVCFVCMAFDLTTFFRFFSVCVGYYVPRARLWRMDCRFAGYFTSFVVRQLNESNTQN